MVGFRDRAKIGEEMVQKRCRNRKLQSDHEIHEIHESQSGDAGLVAWCPPALGSGAASVMQKSESKVQGPKSNVGRPATLNRIEQEETERTENQQLGPRCLRS